jgi:hypothetical protein
MNDNIVLIKYHHENNMPRTKNNYWLYVGMNALKANNELFIFNFSLILFYCFPYIYFITFYRVFQFERLFFSQITTVF